MVDASLATSVAAAGITVLALALISTLRWALSKPAPHQKNADVPVAPYSSPLFGHTFSILRNAPNVHEWLSELCKQFQGKPFRMQLMLTNGNTILNTPELFEDVLKTQFEVFDKGPIMCDSLQDLLGNGIFSVDGVKWMHQRKTASNLFSLSTLRDSMAHTVQELMPIVHCILQRAVNNQAPIDLVKLLNRFTMEGFSKIGFGVDLGCLDAKQDHPFMAAFDTAQRVTTMRFVVPRFVWKLQRLLNIGGERDLKKQIKVIDETVLGIIGKSLEARQRRRSFSEDPEGIDGSGRRDIVSLFLDDVSYNDKREQDPFDPVFLRDIVVSFLIAGRDTTAQALSWFLYELSENPQVEHRIRDELWRCLPHLFSKDAPAPSMEEVQQLLYLEACVKETLRLHPSVPFNFKHANRDTVLVDGTFIPKDSAVTISSYCLGRATHVWGPDAESFRPERWIDPTNPSKLITVSAFQFNSFHAGPRMCLGMNLAMMEMKIFVASVLSKFHMDVVPGQKITYDLSLTLPMKGQFLTHVQAL